MGVADDTTWVVRALEAHYTEVHIAHKEPLLVVAVSNLVGAPESFVGYLLSKE